MAVGTKEKVIAREKNSVKNAVIIGLNRLGYLAYERWKQYAGRNLRFLGFINVFEGTVRKDESIDRENVLGDLRDFDKLVKKHNIKYAIIAVDIDDVSLIHKVVAECNKNGVEYELVSELNDVIYGHTVQQIFKDLQRPIEISFRRFFDIIFALTLLIVFLPTWLIIGLLIKLDSEGPVLYSQERVGKDGRIFRIFKFRTMFTDAEKRTGPTLATKDDPRITKVGRFLRKTRLDEIPQLLNVLIGDMTLIGPRPERPYFVEKYSQEIPMYKNRLKMKPGLTGLAQVNTGYDTSIDDVREKLKYDLYYYERRKSLLFNLKILWKTFIVVMTAQGQ